MKINVTSILFTILLCIVVVFVMYMFLYYKFDKNIEQRNESWAEKLADDKLQALLNGSGINNIPTLNIITTNAAVRKANACGKGPVRIGDTGTDQDCIRACANSTASVINVEPGETYIYESAVLEAGANCILGPRPQCNMKTTYALMTVNSIVCRSKYPDLVGGPLGTTVVACNNKHINDPQNYLWDYRYNKKFDPLSTEFTDANEVLNDGTYRFRCKFNGYDVRQNKLIQHPKNRFQPFRNYCASKIYAAHPAVQTILKDDGSFECDCGDPRETRVQNFDPNDKSSFCSNVSKADNDDYLDRRILKVPYECFTLYSTLEDVGKLFPCPNDQFTRQGSQFSFVEVPYSTKLNAVIEHPIYRDFNDGTVSIKYDMQTA